MRSVAAPLSCVSFPTCRRVTPQLRPVPPHDGHTAKVQPRSDSPLPASPPPRLPIYPPTPRAGAARPPPARVPRRAQARSGDGSVAEGPPKPPPVKSEPKSTRSKADCLRARSACSSSFEKTSCSSGASGAMESFSARRLLSASILDLDQPWSKRLLKKRSSEKGGQAECDSPSAERRRAAEGAEEEGVCEWPS